MYVVGLFAHVTYAPELISKSAQSKIVCSIRLVGCHERKVKLNKHLIECVLNQ